MDHVPPVVLPPFGDVRSPQGADVPALMDLRAFRSIDFTNVAPGQWQRPQHLRANTREVLFVLRTVKLVRAIRVVFAELRNEVVLFGGLILRCVPIVYAPEDTHPAEIALEIDILDLFAHHLFSVERTLLALAVAENLEVVMESVILGIALRS